MIRVALKGLAQHRLRTILTALAIVVGVATMSAAFTLSDTMRQASDASVVGLLRRHRRRGERQDRLRPLDQRLQGRNPTTPPPTLDAVRRVAAGRRSPSATWTNTETRMLDHSGDPTAKGRTSGSGSTAARRASSSSRPSASKHGRWATGPGQVVVDAGTADKQDLKVGGTVEDRRRTGPSQRFRVVGVARFGDVKTIGTATTAVFDLRTAQRLFGERGAAGLDPRGRPARDERRAGAPGAGHRAARHAADPDRGRPRPLHARRPERVRGHHRDRAAGLRRRGDPGRRVHDLQHAVDHGRPARPGVRPAADGGRGAPPGARLRPRGGAGHRRAGLGRRPGRRPRAGQGPERRARRAGPRPAADRHGLRHAHDRGRPRSSARW